MEGLLEKRLDLYAENLKNGNPVFPATGDENKRDFCNALNDKDKLLLADILQEVRDSAIFDTLAYFDWMICCHELNVSQKGINFPNDFFGGDFHCDWVALIANDMWRENR